MRVEDVRHTKVQSGWHIHLQVDLRKTRYPGNIFLHPFKGLMNVAGSYTYARLKLASFFFYRSLLFLFTLCAFQ